jgi:hypothetical protein
VWRYMHHKQLFKNLNILPVQRMHISEIICHIKLHTEKLVQNSAIHNHNTCQKLNLHIQFCRTNAFKKNLMKMGIKLYTKWLNKTMKWKMQCKRELRTSSTSHNPIGLHGLLQGQGKKIPLWINNFSVIFLSFICNLLQLQDGPVWHQIGNECN